MKLKPLLEALKGFKATALEFQSLLHEYDGLDLDVKLEHDVNDTKAVERDEIVFRIEDMGSGEWVSCRVLLDDEDDYTRFALIDEDGIRCRYLGSSPEKAMRDLFPWVISEKIVNNILDNGVDGRNVNIDTDNGLTIFIGEEEGRTNSDIRLAWDFQTRCFEVSVGQFAQYSSHAGDHDFFDSHDEASGRKLKSADETIEFIIGRLGR